MDDLNLDSLLVGVRCTTSLEELEALRIELLGRKGKVITRLKGLACLDPEERRTMGSILNKTKQHLTAAFVEQKEKLHHLALERRLERESPDLTLPVATLATGRIHPIRRTMEEILTVFSHMGFTLKDGPDIEEDFFNFLALNFPENHPARAMQDTFFLKGTDEKNLHKLLRTHTSPVQIRTLMSQQPPIRIVAAGRTFRRDSDQTHAPMFHQVEGLLIDKHTHLGHLKGCLETFCRSIFGMDNLALRFRPSFFPFTEPSLEVDIKCQRTSNKVIIGKGDEWMEILGCGMVHPRVLTHCGHDPQQYQGFAFGIGVERIAMLKYGIPDLRTFSQGLVDWLQHYGFDITEKPSVPFGLNPITF